MGPISWKLLISVLVASASAVTGQAVNGAHFHRHSDSDLDPVQCHHSEAWVNPSSGQESRLDPARQYLPAPAAPKPKEEESPAATYEQPNYLSVEKTLVSPTIQKNYNTLFPKPKPDIVPAAAQNPPNALLPAAPRRTGDKKHSHEDDEDNLERLCNDAFHSFLCKPITGPRKTPTGRLRANAVIPPDVLASLSSIQNVARVRPESPKLQPAPNNIQSSFAKPSTYLPPRLPSTQKPQVYSPPTTRKPYTPPAPFVNILKEDPQEVPSPSNTDQQIIKPHNHQDCDHSKPLATERPKPTYQKPASFQPYYSTTQKPTTVYNFKPNVPLPSNNVPRIAQPFQPAPAHDCKKSKNSQPLVPYPSNQNPIFNKPSFPTTTTQSYNYRYNIPLQSNVISKPAPQHDCDKSKSNSVPVIANPTNNNPVTLKPFVQPTFKPFPTNVNSYSFAAPKSTFAPIKPTQPPHDCTKHQTPFYTQPSSTFKPFERKVTEKPSLPLPSNNIPQIVAQPQQINSVAIPSSPSSGYFYDKPAIPFPSNENPSFAQTTTQKPNGYFYEQPRIPFPSNNVVQVVSQPTTTTTQKPCEHHKPPTQPEEGKPTNQDIVVLKPDSTSDAYVYDKPSVPFPPEGTGPSNQFPVSVKPVSSTAKPTTGYYYDKPANPLLLPNPSNSFRNIAPSPSINGYNYQKPEQNFVSTTFAPSTGYSYDQPKIPFPSSINSQLEDSSNESPNFIAKAQTRVEATVRPGYSYDKPNNPLVTPESTNQNGYTYPKPASAFIR